MDLSLWTNRYNVSVLFTVSHMARDFLKFTDWLAFPTSEVQNVSFPIVDVALVYFRGPPTDLFLFWW